MPRYEYSDSSSDKFWEIQLHGDAYSVRFGRTGSKGTTQQKVFEDASRAKKAYERAVAGKVRKGYVLATDDTAMDLAPSPADAELPQTVDVLLAHLAAFPDDSAAWQVLGDLWTAAGDSRGEHIQLCCAIDALRAAGGDSADGPGAAMRERLAELEAAHSLEWMDAPLAKVARKAAKHAAANDGRCPFRLEWWRGHIRRARVGNVVGDDLAATPTQVKRVLASEAAAFIRELVIGMHRPEVIRVEANGPSHYRTTSDLTKVVSAIGKLGRHPSVRVVELGHLERDEAHVQVFTYNLERLLVPFPNLDTLIVHGGFNCDRFEHPTLRVLTLDRLHDHAETRLRRHKMSALQQLSVGGVVRPVP